ncbi:MAG: type II secretion system protein [Verrucomicrobia bacterium]|nr:type II secretion system protein [Verrucomicrobiota bacterium]MCH8526276.1 type II secretion system GspH family protein [Kiritimatiellia bacterium]
MRIPPYSGSHQERSAFTLIELLVVIAIMVLLIALIFSSVESSVSRARAAACQSNMRQLGLGVIAFTVDNEGRLPGAYGNSANRNVRNGGPFVGKEVLIPEASYTLWLNAPDEVGTLTEYLNIGSGDARRFYRCPALPQGAFDSGIGSNGMFDYTYIKAFGGVKLYTIPATSALRHDGRTISMPTPLFMEEDPYAWSNNMYIDPGFSNADRLGTWHPKNAGHYIAIDGSVQVIRSRNDGQGPRGFDWKAGANPNDFENTGTPFWDSNISYGQWRPGYHL